ncbi:MAG: GNAT family N-acetyltransferase [Flavobacteriales bacterium]|nr:GNAT family N-acetyltransferase [Flavobacteriales bacterium]
MIHREDWAEVTMDASPYLQYDHLRALEDVMAAETEFRYVIYYSARNLPIGVAYFQVVELVDNGSAYREAVGRLGRGIGSRIIKDLKVRSLISGNVFHCGDHGSFFKKGVSDAYRFMAVEDTMRKLDKGGYCTPKASVLIFKDLWPAQFGSAETLIDENYHPLAMDVNMAMDIDPTWRTLDDYQEALTSKARTRIRAVISRSSALEIRSMTADEIRLSTPRLQQLLDQVLARSPFSFGRLKVDVYAHWKEQLGDRLLFHGFFLNDELVGFNSAFVLDDTLDVQYVGFDYDLNPAHAIYQRMLVDVLEFALDNDLRRINFGRTAEQAKSNLGALPVDMRFYVKHRNRLANKLVGPFLRSVKPDAFEQRSPFKKTLV